MVVCLQDRLAVPKILSSKKHNRGKGLNRKQPKQVLCAFSLTSGCKEQMACYESLLTFIALSVAFWIAFTTKNAKHTLTATSTPARKHTSQLGIALAYSRIVSATCFGTLASGDTSGSRRLLCATTGCLRVPRLLVITDRFGLTSKRHVRQDAGLLKRVRPYVSILAVHKVMTMISSKAECF